MSDPRHPPKIVVIVQGSVVVSAFSDKKADVRLFVADYDANKMATLGEEVSHDSHCYPRNLKEYEITVDSPIIRHIINKKKEDR